MLDRLQPHPGSRRRPKRVGRGPGAGQGKTAGRGEKGQGKRSPGRETPFQFEGGQMPLVRRLPKRGFHNLHRTEYHVLNVGALSAFGDGARVDPAGLAERGLVPRRAGKVKILGEGEAPKNLVVAVHRVSAGARRKIEEAGGSVELVE
ncbi:MAG: 50S ribosomal protein L15 [Myxococcales bacterium]|nr:50S ribosomal protein L15 [Myxococcales bacterium]